MTRTIDLFSIAFRGDARLLALQIISVDRLFDANSYDRYVIALNDTYPLQLKDDLLREVGDSVSSSTLDRIDFIPASDMFPLSAKDGWRDQQIIKLLASRHITSEFYLVLDAKNHFVRKAGADDFFDPDGRAFTRFKKPSPAQEKWLRASLQAYDLETDENVRSAMPTTTPYVMHTQTVSDMIEYLEKVHEKPFHDLFRRDLPKATEFFLYYAHMVKHDRVLSMYVNSQTSRSATLFTTWPQDPAIVMKIIAEMETNPERLVFGLHRRRLRQLTPDQKVAIAALWSRTGIADSKGADHYLADASLAEVKPQVAPVAT